MSLEALLVSVLLGAGLTPVVAGMLRVRSRSGLLLVAVPLFLVSTFVAAAFFESRPPVAAELQVRNRPVEDPLDGYVTSQSCLACHPAQYATWHTSYHRTMTQVVSPETVLGEFDVDVDYLGHRFRLERDDDKYFFLVPDETPPTPWRLTLMTGSHHMQAYWFSTGDDRKLAMMPFVYLLDEKRWVPRDAAFLQPQATEIDVEWGRWSRICIRCHATNGRPGMNEAEQFDPRVSEFGIACEACHGPGAEHVGQNHSPWRRYRYHLGEGADPTAVQPEHLAAQRASQVCGQCHGAHEFFDDEQARQFHRTGYRYRPGQDLDDTQLTFRMSRVSESPRLQEISRRWPEWIEGSFWSDGMIRVAGREYNGLLETPCFQHGDEGKGVMSCFSCHQMHQAEDDVRPAREWANDQLKPRMRGNEACLQCHQLYESNERLVAHTHHGSESAGSTCYNCHMSYTTYGLLKAIRSHTVDSPTVQASQATGRPNACNQCHMDKTLAWSAAQLATWYGTPRPELSDDERSVAASVLWALRGDAGQRALMAWSFGWEAAREASGDAWMPLYLAGLLDDPYRAVRLIAHRSLRKHRGYENFQYDFLEAPGGGSSGARRALALWTKQRAWARDAAGRDAVLIGPNGARADEILRLAQQRDDRPVALAE